MRRRQLIKAIDTTALQHNLKQVKKHAPHSKIIAMIKSDAYGHGALCVAKALHEADAFGVAHFEEALQLRHAGIQTPLILMSSDLTQEQLRIASHHALQWVIHETAQISLLKNTPLEHPLAIWMKIDTGMHRLGFSSQEALPAWQALQRCNQVKKPFPLMTHFSCADDLTKSTTTEQIHCFNRITQHWPGERSLANSAGILAWPLSHADWVRPGILLYGISPFPDKTGEALGLKPAMRISAPLIAIHSLQAGDSIGYGETYRCSHPTKIGVIGAGYGDGYPRQAPTGTPVYLSGHQLPLIGRVSMDLMTVDLSTYPTAHRGEETILWGPELPIEIISQKSGVFTYQLACGMAHHSL